MIVMSRVLKAKVICCMLAGFMITTDLFSQDGDSNPLTAGADLYSSYVWRGTKYGSGPAFQPNMKFTTGFFSIGAWGSFDFAGYQEADIYLTLSLPAGFTLGITDYYYPDFDYFDYSQLSGSHAFETSLGFTKGGLNLSANIILNEAGNTGSKGGDKYFEAKYDFGSFNIFLGAGDGWHTTNTSGGEDKFNICNVGLGISQTIRVTETFNIPVTGQLIFNPDSEKMYIVVGFTL
jgi:hypothetical protein